MEIARQDGICVQLTFVLTIMEERIPLFRDHLSTKPASDKKTPHRRCFLLLIIVMNYLFKIIAASFAKYVKIISAPALLKQVRLSIMVLSLSSQPF